ncbi:ATP-binding cassette domain-containing protein [Photorhabdus laumondii]
MLDEYFEQGLINERQREDILNHQLKHGCSVEDAIIDLKILDPIKLARISNSVKVRSVLHDFFIFMFRDRIKTVLFMIANIIVSAFSFPIIFSTYIGFITSQLIYTGSVEYIKTVSYFTLYIASTILIIKYLLGRIYYKSINKFCQTITVRLFGNTAYTSYACFNRVDTPHFISLFTEHIENVTRGLKNTTPLLLESILTISFILLYMVYIDIIMVIVILPFIFLTLYVPQKISKKAPGYIEIESKNIDRINKYLEDVVDNKHLLVTHGIHFFHNQLVSILDGHYINQACKWIYWNLAFNVRVTLVAIISILIISIGGYNIINETLLLSDFISFYFLLVALIPKLDQIFRVFINIQAMSISYNKIIEFVSMPSKHDGIKLKELCSVGSIELNNVRYSVDGIVIIFCINYTFFEGNTYIIQGKSGVGKSTLLKLISRLLYPNDGDIIYRDMLGDDMIFKSSMVSYMYQESMPFLGKSITDNIILNKSFDSELLQFSIEQACFDDVSKRVNDINTELLGANYSGIDLSGGEYQRLELARLIYRDSPIILLDEPTSSLDQELRKKVYSNIVRPEHGKIKIIISHDFDGRDFKMKNLHYCNLSKNGLVEFVDV